MEREARNHGQSIVAEGGIRYRLIRTSRVCGAVILAIQRWIAPAINVEGD
jgi:type IV secretory pathway TrbD component